MRRAVERQPCRPAARPPMLAALAALLACCLATPAGGAAPPPMLQMAQAALRLPPVLGGNSSSEGSAGADAGPSGLLVGVRLVGAAQRPVSADLALELPQGEAPLAPAGAGRRAGNGSAAAEWAPADPAQLWLDPAQLRWDAGEAGIKWTRLRSTTDLPLALVFEGSGSDGSGGSADVTAASLPGGQAVLRVRLAGASGASIAAAPLNATDMLLDAGNRSSNGSAGGQGSASLPMFGFIANQVAYPPSNSSGQSSSRNVNSSAGQAAIPVRLLAGRLGGAATLRYTLRLLQPDVPRGLQAPPQFLPARALQGFLRFTPAPAGSGGGSGSNMGAAVEQQILLPLAWDRIPAEAEYHLGMELESVYGALVAPQPDAVALHVFGTPAGSCPPGAALRVTHNSSTTGAAGAQRSGPGSRSEIQDSLAEPAVGGNGSAGFLLSPNGTVIDISRNLLPGVHAYGAMVEADVAKVTLCIRVSGEEADVQPSSGGRVTALQVPGQEEEAEELEPATDDVAKEACGCDSGSDGDEESGGGCQYAAWELPLLPGQNMFNVTLDLPANQSAADGADNSGSGDGSGGDGGSWEGRQASLAVVRLADPDHAELESLTVRASDDRAVVLCGPPAPGAAHTVNRAALGLTPGEKEGIVLPRSPPPCVPGVLLSLNVSDSNRVVSLTPTLKYPEVPGIRVEVNGQVLSRGGDVQANQVQDTTAAVEPQQTSASFLPSAFIMGLQPGSKLDVEVVVVAEDGVTTDRYPLELLLVESEQRLTPAGSDDSGGNSSVVAVTAEGRSKGWPLSPAQQPMCTICPAGWAATSVNSTACQMCPPGTYAPWPQSVACQPCPPGKFAYSWGSSYCKNCIVGTYAPKARSSLCLACPNGTSTIDDGSSSCSPSLPVNYSAPRYAVVVSFYVNLSGLELEDVVMRAGVDGDPLAIVSSLIRSDTAQAFNISMDDVQVAAVRQVARRMLSANVTAMLGVDVPPGATDQDIEAALEVERLSADKPIEMLSEDPDRFFGRTTQALEVQVQSGMHATLNTVPGPSRTGLIWAMLAPGIVAVVAGSGLVAVGCRRSRACARWRASGARRLATTRLTPLPQRYARYSGSSSGGSDDSSEGGGSARGARSGGEGPS